MESSDQNEIGLVVSKQIIQAMGGKLDFSSQHNVGSTFVFSLQMESCDDEELSLIPLAEAQSGIQAEDSPRFANVMNIITVENKDEENLEFRFDWNLKYYSN